VIKKFFFIALYISLTNCSFDTKTGIWSESNLVKKEKSNSEKIYERDKVFEEEFNSSFDLFIDFKNFEIEDLDINTNNTGVSKKNFEIKKSSKFKFKKIDDFDSLEPDLIFDGNSFIFFDDKSNILKFDKKFKLVWKKNFYSKKEKKLNPLLTFALKNSELIVADNLGNIYKINFITGELIWKINNINPLNSELKIYKDKIYLIDLNNILRCFSLKNGKEIWKFASENSFLKSNKRNSIVIKNDIVYFNNSIGDITALSSQKGLLIWQTPTQSNTIFENAFRLKFSDLVIDDENLFFSNNKNEFYSVALSNGVINWKQNINSSVRPIIINNLIFTISIEGYLFVIDKLSGNIVKVTDVFDNYKAKKRNSINPVGFIISKNKIILSVDNGRLFIINLKTGKTDSILKIDNEKISKPFVFGDQLVLVKDNAIIRLN